MKNIFKFLFVFIVALFSLDYIDLSDTNESGYKENLKYDINKNLKNTQKNNPIIDFENNFEKDEKGWFSGEDGYKYIGDDIEKVKLPNGKNLKVIDLWIQENEDLILYIREHLPLPAAAANTFTITLKPTDPEYKYIIENNEKIASALKYIKGEGIDLNNPKNIVQYNTGYNEKDYMEYETENLKNTKENNPILNLENNFEEDEINDKKAYRYIDNIKELKIPNLGEKDYFKIRKFYIKENGDIFIEYNDTKIIFNKKGIIPEVSHTTINEITLKPTDPEYKYIIENNQEIASMVKYIKGEEDLDNPKNIVQYNTGYNEKDYMEYETENLKNTKENNSIIDFKNNFEKDEKGFFIGEDGYKYIGDDIEKVKLPNKIVGNYATYAKSLGDTKYVNINGKNSKVFDLWIQENEDLILYIREHLPLPAAAAKTFIITLKPTDPEYKYIIENNKKIASAVKYVKGENDLY